MCTARPFRIAVCAGAALATSTLALGENERIRGAEYSVTYLGEATTVTGMNASGAVIGTIESPGAAMGWVWQPNAGMELLTSMPGSTRCIPLAINDLGVIVGECDGMATQWLLVADGSTLGFLPPLPGQAGSVATAINNRGDVVGYAGVPGELLAPVWFTAPGGPQKLNFPTLPNAINDSGVIVGGRFRMSLDTMAFEDLGLPPDAVAAEGLAINEHGQIAGFVQLMTPETDDLVAVRYTDRHGWEAIDTYAGPYNRGYDLNDLGEVVLSPPARVLLSGYGLVSLEEATPSPTEPEDWVFPQGVGMAINNCGEIATVGNNLFTGEYGAVLLTRIGAAILGDINEDGVVDQADVGLLLANYGTEAPGGKIGDLDGDLDVDQADLGILLSNFGRSCR